VGNVCAVGLGHSVASHIRRLTDVGYQSKRHTTCLSSDSLISTLLASLRSVACIISTPDVRGSDTHWARLLEVSAIAGNTTTLQGQIRPRVGVSRYICNCK